MRTTKCTSFFNNNPTRIVAVVAAGRVYRREELEARLWEAREGPGRENLAAALTTLFTHTLPVAPLLSDALSFFGFGGK